MLCKETIAHTRLERCLVIKLFVTISDGTLPWCFGRMGSSWEESVGLFEELQEGLVANTPQNVRYCHCLEIFGKKLVLSAYVSLKYLRHWTMLKNSVVVCRKLSEGKLRNRDWFRNNQSQYWRPSPKKERWEIPTTKRCNIRKHGSVLIHLGERPSTILMIESR